MTPGTPPKPIRLGPWESMKLGSAGVRARPMRAVLAALGIAIGVAALIAVVGIPASNQSALNERLAALGPNLLRVEPGDDRATNKKAVLPTDAQPMIARIGHVSGASATGDTGAKVWRSDLVPRAESGGLQVVAAHLDLPTLLRAEIRTGGMLTPVTERFPVAVLGARAAHLLGIEPVPGQPPPLVWIKDRWFAVTGVLHPIALAAEIDNSVLVGWHAAQRYLDFDGHPARIYVRANEDAVESVKSVLGRTANPEHPEQVLVSRPSDVLVAQRLVSRAFDTLLLGLGAVALLVGGIGVANTMVISVLERRREIGLRRALGATRGQIGGQFLAESVLLTGIGGGIGLLLGIAVTAGYAAYQGWPAVLPVGALTGGVAAAVAIGVLAGVYPATRAARLTPTEALATT
nr:Protein of unknown function DUF214 [Kibdelosporangium sp. MJ126-NF4]CTQ92907.1 Protein of unknown function DUF214 [Kibdelosporangium sp. MJ126-NF4]